MSKAFTGWQPLAVLALAAAAWSPIHAASPAVPAPGAVAAPAAASAVAAPAMRLAQASEPQPASGQQPAAGTPSAAPSAPASLAGAAEAGRTGGMQSANIFDVPSADDAAAQAERQRTQPLNNAPVWREVTSGNAHYTSLPGREMGVLIQRGGEPWRRTRNELITFWGGWALVAALLAIGAFYAWKGPMRLHEPRTGRLIERFTVFERLTHRVMSVTFVALGATGALMLFGKYVVLPVFGYSAFSVIAALSKNAHNFLGPLFAASVAIAFFVFVRDNKPNRSDLEWVRKAGGLMGGAHVSAGRFNAGEKAWFWGGMTLLGIIVSASGFVLDFPNFEQTRGQMQLAWIVHAVGALLFLLGSFGHIYMGTIGVEGVREAMRTGYVDETWAKEHHDLWYRDVVEGRIPRVRSRQPDAAITPDGRPAT